MSKWNFDKMNYLINSGEYQKALEIIDEELKTNPSNYSAWVHKGKIISMSGVKTTEGSARMVDFESKELDSKLAWFYNALRCFDKAIEINSVSDWAYENKALTLSRMGKTNEAIELALRVIEINPKNFSAMANLVLWYNKLEDFDNAIKLADMLISQKSLIEQSILGMTYFNKAQSQFFQNNSSYGDTMNLAIQNTSNHEMKKEYENRLKDLISEKNC